MRWGNPAGGFWDEPTNWIGGRLPGPGDNVIIDVPGDPRIIHRSGTNRIYSLTSAEPFTLSGGTLEVATSVQVNNAFRIEGGEGTPPALSRARVLPGTPGSRIDVRGNLTLDNVTLEADMTLAQAGVTVTNGLTINGTITAGAGGGRLDFPTSQTLAGTGQVLLRSDAGGAITAGDSLTIGSGITIRADGIAGLVAMSNLINQGTIIRTQSAGGLNVVVSGTFSNQGTIILQGASLVSFNSLANDSKLVALNTTLLLRSNRWNGGIIEITNSTLIFEGEYTTEAIGVVKNSAGRVILGGLFDNRGRTLTLDARTGSWETTGTVLGGRLVTLDGTVFKPDGGLWDGVTLDGDTQILGRTLAVTNRLTVNGAMLLGTAIDLMNENPLEGTGRIAFTGRDGRLAPWFGRPFRSLTIGRSLTVHGGSGTIGNVGPSSGDIFNHGTIFSDQIDRVITVAGRNLINDGILGSAPRAQLVVTSPLVNSGQLNPGGAGGAGFVTVMTNYEQTSSGVLNLEIGGSSTNQFDRLFVGGQATFGGILNLSLIGGFRPSPGNSFQVVTFGSRAGDFAVTNGQEQGGLQLLPQYIATNLTITVQSP